MISFTGSSRGGRAVAELAAKHLKRVHLELGGNSAMIVLDDVDVEKAVSVGAFGSFMHQGQICMTTGRHLVASGASPTSTSSGWRSTPTHLPVGNPATEQVALGPIIDEQQRDHVHAIVTESVDAGRAPGGRRHVRGPLLPADRAGRRARPTRRRSWRRSSAPWRRWCAFDSIDEAVKLADGQRVRPLARHPDARRDARPRASPTGSRAGSSTSTTRRWATRWSTRSAASRSSGPARIGGAAGEHRRVHPDAVGDDAGRAARVPVLSLAPRGDAHAGRDRRRRPGRASSVAPAAPRGHRLGGAGGPRAASTSSNASAQACWSRRRVELLREPRAGGSAGPRGARPPRHRDPVRRPAPPHRADRPDRPCDLHLRPAGAGEGPHRGPAGRRRRRSCSRWQDVRLGGIETDAPSIRYRADERRARARCDFDRRLRRLPRRLVARRSPGRPAGSIEHEYPFAWLGILAAVAPSTDELIYAPHERGFALHSLRSPEISRLYLQVDPRRGHRGLAGRAHLGGVARCGWRSPGWQLADGPVLEKGITPMRSFVAEPMQSREAVPGRRRRTHRAGDRREGPEPRGQRRARTVRGDRRVVHERRRTAAGRVLGPVPAARLARAALLAMDELRCCTGYPGDDRSAAASSGASSTTSPARPRRPPSLAENYVGTAVRLNRREHHAYPDPVARRGRRQPAPPRVPEGCVRRCRPRRDRRRRSCEAAQERAGAEAIALQEATGIDVLTDGEVRRRFWFDPLTTSLSGYNPDESAPVPFTRGGQRAVRGRRHGSRSPPKGSASRATCR